MTNQSRRITIRLEGEAGKAVGQLQLRAWQALTSATPVDTGYARAGWTPSVGNARAELTAPRPADERTARGVARKANPANRRTAQTIADTYRLDQGSVFITNGVPYIGFLNGGSSAQAPKQFVERAINKAVRAATRGR